MDQSIALLRSLGIKKDRWQVWPLTQFFLFRFCNKIINLPGGQIIFPLTPSSLSWTLKGLFELTLRPSMALDSPRALLPALQRHKDTVRCAALVVEVPGHRQQQLTQTLIMRLLKTHFFTPILDFKSQQKRELVTIAGTVTGDLGEP